MCVSESDEYELLKHNLKIYNRYLNQCIRIAKKTFYYNGFSKYKNDIRKTWDTKNKLLTKKNFKSDFPSNFLHDGVDIKGSKTSPINSMSTLLKSDIN